MLATNNILWQPSRWFAIDRPVSRRDYLTLGLSLGVLKYVIELICVAVATGQFFTPVNYINPWLNSKAPFLIEVPGAAIVWLIFTLPFVAIAVSMTVRRAADAGWSPWWGLAMLIPLANLFFMALLSIVPTRSTEQDAADDRANELTRSAYLPPTNEPADEMETWDRSLVDQNSGSTADAFGAIGAGAATQVLTGLLSVWVLREYGFILFFAAPVYAGAVSGFLYNTRRSHGYGALFGITALMNLIAYAAMLGVGLDGAICLFMAFPLLLPLSYLGAVIGRAISISSLRNRDERKGMWGAIILLPLTLALEPLDDSRALHPVDTTVVINAPTTVVWDQVVAFPEITAEPAWFFKAGIAAPIRARIEGTGVGACRYCEFTTGPFVEPITQWDQPRSPDENGLLAFDVVSQPQPMTEWTPFSGLHPPHLDEGFVSRRGQFRLESLSGGRTRLTGTTWYDIDVRPRLYWKAWADPTIHAIHHRVLDHIRLHSEATVASAESSR